MTDQPFTGSSVPQPGQKVLLRLHMLNGAVHSRSYVVPASGWSGRIEMNGQTFVAVSASGLDEVTYRFNEI